MRSSRRCALALSQLVALALLATCDAICAQEIGQRIVIVSEIPVPVYDGDDQLGEVVAGDVYTFEGRAPNSALIRFRGHQVSVPAASVSSKLAAIEIFSRSLEEIPTAQKYAIRGRLHYNLKDFAKAHEDFDRALELDENNLWAHEYRAAAYEQEGRDKLAMQAVERAMQLEPNDAGLYTIRSALQERAGNMEQSIADLKKAIEIDPFLIAARYNLAVALWASKQCQEELKTLIEIEPYYYIGYFGLAAYFENSEDSVDEAIKTLDQAIDLGIRHRELFSARSRLHYESGGWSQYYSDLVSLAECPGASETQRNMGAWILATHPADDYRDGRRAVRIATKLCADNGWSDAEYIATLAAALAETGAFERALETLERIDSKTDELDEMRKLFEAGKPFRSEDERPFD